MLYIEIFPKRIIDHSILLLITLQKVRGSTMLAEILITIGQIGIENEAIKEIDINPVIIFDGKPVAVDALVVVEGN